MNSIEPEGYEIRFIFALDAKTGEFIGWYQSFSGQVFRIFPPSIIALNISIKALKMYRYSYKLIQTNYNIISHHDNTNYYNFVMLTIT